jgi:hypothetical protein
VNVRRVIAVFACLMTAGLCWSALAVAAVPTTGAGFGIADDETNWDNLASFPDLGDGFARLRPQVFRFQTIWDTIDNPEWITRAENMIERAEAHGVQTIVVTLRSNNEGNVGPYGYFPTAAQYEEKVAQLVDRFADDVDVWGPANEPNGAWRPDNAPGGEAPLPAATLASYQLAFETVVAVEDPTALTTSPDFLDGANLGSIAGYVDAYEGAGGGWGDIAAFHPYNGVTHKSLATMTDFVGLIPAGRPIWLTEVGAHNDADTTAQDSRVAWIVNTLGAHSRVAKIFYYHVRDNNDEWDTALLNSDQSPRPGWRTWCAATHGGNASHADCGGYMQGITSVDLASPAAVHRGNGVVDLFARGDDGAIFHKLYVPGTGWSAWGSLGGEVSSGPAVITYGNGELDVFARGTDNQLKARYYRVATGWGSWVSPGGVMTSSPAAVHRGNGLVDVLARGADGSIMHKYYAPGQGWTAFGTLGGSFVSGPAVITYGNGELDVFARSTSGDVMVKYYRVGTGWGGWSSLGSP